jgi:hypothetical protein
MTREKRLRLFESNYGRDFGWLVEHSGRTWVTLTEPRFEDMFWVSYHIEPIYQQDTEMVLRKEFWAQNNLIFRNQVIDGVAPNAFAAMGNPPTKENPRVTMRGLSLYCSEPTRTERFLLWWRRRKNRQTR